MVKQVVFVIGATGSIGFATVSALSGKYAHTLEVRAGVRNPDKADKLKTLANVTVVKAEMGSDDLTTTLKGIHALYIVVPGAENRADLTVKTANAAKAAGVKFLLVVSTPSADYPDTILGKQYNKIESDVKALGLPHCIVRLTQFTDSFLAFKNSIKDQSAFYGPLKADVSFPIVTTADAGAAGAAILSDVDRHAGKTYSLVSDHITNGKAAESFSVALGKEVKYVCASYEDAEKAFRIRGGLEEWQVKGLMEMCKLMNDGSVVYHGHENMSDYETITGKKPTSFEDWLAPLAGAFK